MSLINNEYNKLTKNCFFYLAYLLFSLAIKSLFSVVVTIIFSLAIFCLSGLSILKIIFFAFF